jgi:hypothetical protein
MATYYSNITLRGPSHRDIISILNHAGQVAYVAPAVKRCTVIFHHDLGAQERLAAELSARFRCPAMLVMAFRESILLYDLYSKGDHADAYVSSPHEGLELDGPAPEGDAAALCAAFSVQMDHLVRRVERILRTPTRAGGEFALAVNRHGELLRALGLPLLAAGAGFAGIELGELPEAADFHLTELVRTGARSAAPDRTPSRSGASPTAPPPPR